MFYLSSGVFTLMIVLGCLLWACAVVRERYELRRYGSRLNVILADYHKGRRKKGLPPHTDHEAMVAIVRSRYYAPAITRAFEAKLAR